MFGEEREEKWGSKKGTRIWHWERESKGDFEGNWA